ncbi:MAG: alpha/beta hydrolase [Nocardioidaceae bacterium]
MTLHPQAAAVLAVWNQEPSTVGADLAEIQRRRRAAVEEAAAEPHEPVAEAVEVDADGVACRLFRPVGGGRGAVVHAHGGGFVYGDATVHDAQARRLANRLGRSVLLVDYRRPPEHPFPAAHDDVSTAARWLGREADGLGLDAAHLVALGDSAGGNLALVAALRDPGLFAACVLVYPFVDPRLRGESFASEGGHGLTREESDWFWRTYAGSDERHRELLDDPEFCPVDAPGLGTLPPTQVFVAEHDVLGDEADLLAERMTAAGVEVETLRCAGMIHGFWRHPEAFDAAEAAYAATAAFLDRVLGAG